MSTLLQAADAWRELGLEQEARRCELLHEQYERLGRDIARFETEKQLTDYLACLWPEKEQP